MTRVHETDASSKDIHDYWHPERMAEAEPIELPVVERADYAEPPGTSDGPTLYPPNRTAQELLERATAGVQPLATPVPDPTDAPMDSNGKLFFTRDGDDYVGSAHAIATDVILTAGHCLFSDGHWSDNVLYVPGYPGLGGKWTATRKAVFSQWTDSTNYAFDYGMAALDQPLRGVGSVGAVTGLAAAGRTWTAVGYPAEPPYHGRTMYEATGRFVDETESVVTMANNDMTEGSSGGAWLTDYGTQGMVVNGVQSHRGSSATQASSPFFDTRDFLKLLEAVAPSDSGQRRRRR